VMVLQTLQFLFENAVGQVHKVGDLMTGFLAGMRYANPSNPGSLLYWKQFQNAAELFSFDAEVLSDAIRQLELHTDINLTFARVSYLADVGCGPDLPLLILNRLPFSRGVAFEIEERTAVTQSFQLGDFHLSEKVRVAQQHYSCTLSVSWWTTLMR
jgi:hypothetical protein